MQIFKLLRRKYPHTGTFGPDCPVALVDPLEAYLTEHDLPDEKNYHDPTKVLENRECGLHLTHSGL